MHGAEARAPFSSIRVTVLKPSWGHLGCILGTLGTILVQFRPSWTISGPPGTILGLPGAILGPSGVHLGAIWGPSGGHLEAISGHLGITLGDFRATKGEDRAQTLIISYLKATTSAADPDLWGGQAQ